MIKPGYFVLEGINSEDVGMIIQDRSQLNAPRRKQNAIQPYGYSGSLIIDEEAYEDSEMELILWVNGKDDKEASEKREKIFYMFDSGRYLEFIPYWDPDKIHRVRVDTPLLFTPKYWHLGGQPFSITLAVAPYKYYTGYSNTVLTSPGTINNPKLDSSKPIIKVVGSGSITLTVNGEAFRMQDIQSEIILDSQMSFAYREPTGSIINDNDKIFTREYPVLKPGNNTISWTGSVTRVEIEPRWRTLI